MNLTNKLFHIALFVLTSFLVSGQDRWQWFEFYLQWNDSTKTVTDMLATLDGHFWFRNKTVFKNYCN